MPAISPAQIAGLMMIGSGLAHAIVNAIFKAGGSDKMSGRAMIDGSAALLVMPLILVVPLPHNAWIWLAGSLTAHAVYLTCLVRAFSVADMSAVYPVMRGSAPVIAALASVLLLGDPITLAIALGIALVTMGTLLVALRNAPPLHALGWALGTGAAIATYTVIDARGVRAAPTTLSYVAWDFLITGVGIGGFFALRRGREFVSALRTQWRPGLAAGSLSIVSYGLALGAYRLGNVARLASLRETSIVFGLVIAAVFLRERVNHTRAMGGALIALGAAALIVLN
jgi:drug/metabolite transporter (DMT)-like permease